MYQDLVYHVYLVHLVIWMHLVNQVNPFHLLVIAFFYSFHFFFLWVVAMMGRARVLGQWKDYAARRITNGGPTLPQDCHELLSCVLVSYGLHIFDI